MKIWLLSENRIFWPWILKISRTKYTLPEATWRIACNIVLIFFITFMSDIINCWTLDKNYAFFSDIYFRMDIIMGMLREDFLTT